MAQTRAHDYFHGADGAPLPVGYTLKSPAMAATLRRLAAHGAQAFYDPSSDIARDIVATVREARDPGDMTERDLANYKARVREPICAPYRQYRVCGMPPPSSGGIALLQMLGVLERFDIGSLAPESALSVHLFSEAGRLAYADRDRYIGDPAFVALPEGLLVPDYLRSRAAEIRVDASMGRAEPGSLDAVKAPRKAAFADGLVPELPSTSQISIVDRDGNAVSMTTSIEFGFGSGLMTKSGFLLNNQLTDFSFLPEYDGRLVANRVEPGKRPRSSMAPTLVYDDRGRLYMIVGSPGGPAIINYVAKTVVAVLDWKLDAQAAADLPNVGSRNGPTEIERGSAAEALEPALRALGHDTRSVGLTSGVNAIVRRGREWTGGSDPRREGVARGN
jgi:gamma-glutamyltranspeptidase/glutathione hydrolase